MPHVRIVTRPTHPKQVPLPFTPAMSCDGQAAMWIVWWPPGGPERGCWAVQASTAGEGFTTIGTSRRWDATLKIAERAGRERGWEPCPHCFMWHAQPRCFACERPKRNVTHTPVAVHLGGEECEECGGWLCNTCCWREADARAASEGA